MTIVKLKHLDAFTDRHGRRRYYFRKGKGARIALPGVPGSPEFLTAYQRALNGHPVETPLRMRGNPGTFDRLVQEYFASPDYLRLNPQTQRTYRLKIERLLERENIGHRLVAQMTRQHVRKILANRAATPGGANDDLKKLKILMHFAIDNGWRNDDPTLRIKKYAEGEIHTWSDEEIARYEARWPAGSRERLAFALFIHTGQRASDVARMSWVDVESEGIWVVQKKTKAKLLIPLHPELQAILLTAGRGEGPLLETSFDKPFTAKGLSNFMADRIEQARLPERCVTHGLRKAAARRLAEAGCSANEIASITGHVTLEEVARYTRAAEQKKLARSAIGRLAEGAARGKFPNLESRFGENQDLSNEINDDYGIWRPVGDSNPCSQRERLVS